MADFPVKPIRKHFGKNYPKQIVQTVSVPNVADEDGFYWVELDEVPARASTGVANPYSDILKLTHKQPNSGEFFIDFEKGWAYFHTSDKGKSVQITYYGSGSPVSADHINTLYDRLDPSLYLSKVNTTSYTPTADYHPATKKYVDDNLTAGTVAGSDREVQFNDSGSFGALENVKITADGYFHLVNDGAVLARDLLYLENVGAAQIHFNETNSATEWKISADTSFNIKNTGGSNVLSITSAGLFSLLNGTSVDNISTDGTLSGDSDDVLVTEKAIKTYVDANAGGGSVSTGSVTAGSSGQGDTELTDDWSFVTYTNANDAATLPTPSAGKIVVAINVGTEVGVVYPASGHDLGNGVDTLTFHKPNETMIFRGIDATTWAPDNFGFKLESRLGSATAGHNLINSDNGALILRLATDSTNRSILGRDGANTTTQSGIRLGDDQIELSDSSSVFLEFNGGTSSLSNLEIDLGTNTGIAEITTDELSLVAGGVELLRLVETGTSTTDQVIIGPGGIIGTAATPALAFGDGDTGFYENVANQLSISIAGSRKWFFNANELKGDGSNTAWMQNIASNATTPTVGPSKTDFDTGLGWNAADQLSLVAGGVELLRLVETGTNTTNQVIIGPGSVIGAAGTPGLAFGDGDTGFVELSDDNLDITCNGTRIITMNSTRFAVPATNGAQIKVTASTVGLPSFTNATDTDTGLHLGGSDLLSLITGGVEAIRLTEASGHVIQKMQMHTGISASTTQTQGQQPLLSSYNQISTVSNPNDVVTLMAAEAGIVCTVINDGSNILQIFPASGDDLGAGVDKSITLSVGSTIIFVARDSTNWKVTNVRFDNPNIVHLWDEFNADYIAGQLGNLGWRPYYSGTGSLVATTASFATYRKSLGDLYLNSGSTSSGIAAAALGPKQFDTGICELDMRWMTVAPNELSTVSEEFVAFVGFANNTNWASATNAIGFLYDRATYGDHWVTVTRSVGVTTHGNTTAIGAEIYDSSPYGCDLRFVVNAEGTSVAFYDGTTPLTAHTTNIPNYGVGGILYPVALINKTVGTTPRNLYIARFDLFTRFTNNRDPF